MPKAPATIRPAAGPVVAASTPGKERAGDEDGLDHHRVERVGGRQLRRPDQLCPALAQDAADRRRARAREEAREHQRHRAGTGLAQHHHRDHRRHHRQHPGDDDEAEEGAAPVDQPRHRRAGDAEADRVGTRDDPGLAERAGLAVDEEDEGDGAHPDRHPGQQREGDQRPYARRRQHAAVRGKSLVGLDGRVGGHPTSVP